MLATALLPALVGGLLIGSGAAVLLLCNGRVAGISSIAASSLHGTFGPSAWRLAFLAGLVLPAIVFGAGEAKFNGGPPWLAASGLLVGLGTRLGSGCTSGHGVCGLANFSRRSLVATLIFMTVAVVVVFATRQVLA